jgi:hypothetical protein
MNTKLQALRATFLACLIEAKQRIANSLASYPGCSAARNGGDPPDASQEASDTFQSLIQNLPSLLEAVNAGTLPTALAQFEANSTIAPKQAQLEADLYAKYGPQVAKTQAEIKAAQDMAASNSELALAQGPGQGLVQQAIDLQKQVDPEAQNIKELVNSGLEKYLASQNGGDLNASELEQISRGIAQQGGSAMPESALKTLNAARTFGDAGTQRWKEFGSALSTAANVIPTLRSGISGFEVATRRQVGQDPTARLSAPATVNANQASNQNFAFADNALNQIGQTSRTIINKQESNADKALKASSAAANIFSMAG